ncbi:MAG: hypothetical protein AABZ33_05775 [Chloroflexota bacterium]
MIDALQNLWHQILDVLSLFIIPDWGEVINLIPLLLLAGLIGPLLTIAALVWFVYAVRRPRTGVQILEGPDRAQIGADGQPIFPTAEPYCHRDALIYPAGATHCDECRDDLLVRCPKCSVGRVATMAACGNCGLELNLKARVRTVSRIAGPPPGGAAIA